MPETNRRPTLRDIADDTGLSTASVSYALRGLHVPAETQERVREAADRLGYQVNPIARALAGDAVGSDGNGGGPSNMAFIARAFSTSSGVISI